MFLSINLDSDFLGKGLMFCNFDWLIYWLIDWLIDWLIEVLYYLPFISTLVYYPSETIAIPQTPTPPSTRSIIYECPFLLFTMATSIILSEYKKHFWKELKAAEYLFW